MVEHQPARLQQLVDLAEIGAQVGAPHMFEHAHRGDLVEARARVEFAVVAQLHPHPVLQALLRDQLLHMGLLVLRQRDAGGVHAVMLRRPHQQRTPARTDVEELFAGAQHELAADVVEFGLLGLCQRHVGVREVGAGIDPPRVQPQLVERVTHVVVELDLARIALQRMGHRRAGAARQVLPPGGVTCRRVAGQQAGGHRHHITHRAFDADAIFDEAFGHGADLAREQKGDATPAGKLQYDAGLRRPDLLPARKAQRHGQPQSGQLGLGGADQLVHGRILASARPCVNCRAGRLAGCPRHPDIPGAPC